ncbi:MAG TPA: hypothetical protein VFO98_08150 [Marmoricola sp.]|jgi:hypothetical protein|nr:hypothetical protein [Marmoricola sp.]
MEYAALATGIAAALMGGYLLATWIANGGLRRDAHGNRVSSRFGPALIFGHGGMAATGMAVWVVYLLLSTTVIAWVSLGALVAAAVLGATMFGLWLRSGYGRPRGKHAAGPRHAAEGSLPPPAVLLHGLFAVTTVGLVLTTAVQASR